SSGQGGGYPDSAANNYASHPGHNANGGPRSPTNTSFPHNMHGNAANQAPPAHFASPPSSTPSSPTHMHSPHPGGPGGPSGPGGPGAPVPGMSPSASMLATPQLFWAQRRMLGTNPFPRFQHTTSVTTSGTDIFLFGGSQRGATKGDLFVIDSDFGGWDAMTGQCDDSMHVLHTGRREWNRPQLDGALPTPRHSHTGCSVGTIMYIFGGQIDGYYLDDIVAFDMKSITTNPRWDKIVPQTESPPARSGHCAGVFEGKLYIFGGADADYFYNDIWCFDPRALTWTPIPASGYLPSGRHGHACTVMDGTMYIFGGNSPDGTELNDAYAFKINERRWYLFQNIGPVASPRSGHTMCTIKDRIFVLGGESEQTKLEDSALIYFLETSKIRYPESNPHAIPPRQTSSVKAIPKRPMDGMPQSHHAQTTDTQLPGGYDPEKSPGKQHGYPNYNSADRPERPDRRNTQRAVSPVSHGHPNSGSNVSQLLNPQFGQRPMTTLGAPPPRSASSGFQKNDGTTPDYQMDGPSAAARRQTMRDDFQGEYGGALVAQNSNRRTMHQVPTAPAPTTILRVVNVSPEIPPRPAPARSHEEDDSGNTTAKANNDFVSPPTTPGAGGIVPSDLYSGGTVDNNSPGNDSPITSSYIPPPPPPGGSRPTQSTTATPSAGGQTPLPPSSTATSPPHGMHPSTSPLSASPAQTYGVSDKSVPISTSALSPGSSTPIPGPLDRMVSQNSIKSAERTTPTFSPGSGSSNDKDVSGLNREDQTDDSQGSKRAQLELEKLRKELSERESELARFRVRQDWLVAEVVLSRENGSKPYYEGNDSSSSSNDDNRRLSVIDLERALENGQMDDQQRKMTKTLLRVREELKSAKISIATQAHAASIKVKEAERIRTGALQEAAYLKAKLSAISNAQQDPGALARVETDRSADLEKRLTHALGDLENLEAQYTAQQESLEQERRLRSSAEDRSNGSALLAEQAQSAHERALAELALLHSRAAKAETESREYAAQLVESQAGFTGHQSHATNLLQKVATLKEQSDQQEKALEKVQMAYTTASERALRAETRYDELSDKVENLESVRLGLLGDVNRYKAESERLQSKVEELDSRWQISKDEVLTLRKLVEDGLGSFSPRGRAPERKHDSIAILSNVSRVSELEHELGSLKKLHAISQESASRSASELAEAMIEVSRLEQTSMQARVQTLAVQKQLSQERENGSQLRAELSKLEKDLESRTNELENNEVQLGLLKDVMRDKGIIAEDLVTEARFRGTGEYSTSLEQKVKQADARARSFEQEMEDTRLRLSKQVETSEAQRQLANQRSEKSTILLRKLKDDLEVTIREKDATEIELKTLLETHARCGEQSQDLDDLRDSLKEEEEERVRVLQARWEEERRGVKTRANGLQSRLVDSEMLSNELSQKIISLTERIQEVEAINETMSDELESAQRKSFDKRETSRQQEDQLKADVEKLVDEIHLIQDKLHEKERQLEDAFELNEQLETQLDRALETQAVAVNAASSASNSSQVLESQLKKAEQERNELLRQLQKTEESIRILEGDNSMLESRLLDSEKRVALLLENMQGTMSDNSHPVSPLNSDSIAGLHQQLSSHLEGKTLRDNSSPTSISPGQTSRRTSANSTVSNAQATAHRLISHVKNSSINNATSGIKNGNGINTVTSGSSGSLTKGSSTTQSSKGAMASAKYLHFYDEDDEEDREAEKHGQHGYGQAQSYLNSLRSLREESSNDDDMQPATQRDSMDSITRELELLKVPQHTYLPQGGYFDSHFSNSNSNSSNNKMSSYTSKTGEHKFYQHSEDSQDDIDDIDDDDDDNTHTAFTHSQKLTLPHLRKLSPSPAAAVAAGSTRAGAGTATATIAKNTPQYYERMIDEIESSRV
ncbi:Negative regulator of mitotic exit, partial [Lunasporangiospora selenospora]